MILTVISRKTVGLVLGIVSIFKKLLCFLNIRRGRRNSGHVLPLHNERISTTVPQSVPAGNEVELESWDTWDDGFSQRNGGQQANGRQRNINNQDQSEEPEVDFFQDMTPRFKGPPKILIKPKENYSGGNVSNRLAMTTEVPLVGDGLGVWEDTENAWSQESMEDLSWEADSAIREKKLLEREKRLAEHSKRKQDKEALKAQQQKSGQFAAVKLS